MNSEHDSGKDVDPVIERRRKESTLERIEIPVRGRSQQHAVRHVADPEIHEPADDDVIDAAMTRKCSYRETERSGTNDEKRHFF